MNGVVTVTDDTAQKLNSLALLRGHGLIDGLTYRREYMRVFGIPDWTPPDWFAASDEAWRELGWPS